MILLIIKRIAPPMAMIIFSCLFLFIRYSSNEEPSFNNPKIDEPDSLEFPTTHFTFYITAIDKKNIPDMAQYLENNYDRIITDLKIKDLSRIKIRLYAYLKELHQALGWPDAPDWVKGAATAKDEIRMISPNSPEIGNTTFNYMLSCIVHEFAHCVCLQMNSTIANKPRWLWESVAIYESKQFVDPRNLSYMRTGLPPSLKEMDNINDTRIYNIGYTIIEYLLSQWGAKSFTDLIKSNGNLAEILKINESEFESGWYEFVKNKYLQ